jgi:hypothetical protein
MRKRHSRSRGVLNKLLIILILFTLLITLVGHLHDQNGKVNLLIKRHNQQQTKIEKLEYENQRLHNVSAYQLEKIKELQQNKPVAIAQEAPVEARVTKEDTYDEKTNEDMRIDVTPTVVVTALVAIGGIARMLIPAIP